MALFSPKRLLTIYSNRLIAAQIIYFSQGIYQNTTKRRRYVENRNLATIKKARVLGKVTHIDRHPSKPEKSKVFYRRSRRVLKFSSSSPVLCAPVVCVNIF